SGNVDHRGLIHSCRVSPSSPAPFFWTLTAFLRSDLAHSGDSQAIIGVFPLREFLVNTGRRNFTGTVPLTLVMSSPG
ncbi:hypothetical protein D4764_10G0005290, partial [Takifugu flavidus]